MKKANALQSQIAAIFRKQVQKDPKVKNAYLFVHSEKLNVLLNIAEGNGDTEVSPQQPNHMASVGKLFTATIIGILYEKNKLDYNDSICRYLDPELTNGLHIYKGKDYTKDITIRHLLMQTSGLNDVFYHLWEKFKTDPDFSITPLDAVLWGKENLKPVAVPGKRHFYTDTNYYLLGLIVENITGKKFHEVMHELIFEPLGMDHAYMYGFSKPKVEPGLPMAKLLLDDIDIANIPNVHQIDYAGGSIVAPLEEYYTFMKSLINHKIVKEETLNRMIIDDIWKGFPTLAFNYGYSVWKLKAIPFLLPKTYYSWGCVGVSGAFMFYHPLTESYIIGTFNNSSYMSKGLDFMIKKLIKALVKHSPA
ncbi:serine hydrolase [Cytophagaceae bacterium ABcell3]|nr:serine hydrolase [Cytophagaceae bacterium ABcell3]